MPPAVAGVLFAVKCMFESITFPGVKLMTRVQGANVLYQHMETLRAYGKTQKKSVPQGVELPSFGALRNKAVVGRP